MKISEMTNDQATEAMIRLCEPFANICDSEEMQEMLFELKTMRNAPILVTVGRMIPKLTAYAIRTHKKDVYEIVSILSGKPYNTVGKMNFAETVRILRDSYDDVLAGFFPKSVVQANGEGEK